MILRKISIVNFKSIETATLNFSDKVNCFIGLNGMGKTNVLDALHYLSFTRSHLGITDSLAVRKGAEASILEGLYITEHDEEKQVLLQIRPGQRKILKRNKKEYARLSEHIGFFPLVIISPQDFQLIQGNSDERRRFLDMQLSQQDSSYMHALHSYNGAIDQRNRLLKSDHQDDNLLDVLDHQLSHYAKYIWEKRREFVEVFKPYFQDYYISIAQEQESINLEYISSLNSNSGNLYELLYNQRIKDKIVGYTSVGIHRDDLNMSLGEDPIKKVGSEGQRKTYLISLKLAQYRILNNTNPEKPMLLLDDIFDKLDAERVSRIIELVGGENFGQIFITDTNRKYLHEIIHSWGKDFQIFSVDKGKILEHETY